MHKFHDVHHSIKLLLHSKSKNVSYIKQSRTIKYLVKFDNYEFTL